MDHTLEKLILKLSEINAFKFGDFTLKSGIQSPVYFDLRVLISYPELMVTVSEFLFEAIKQNGSLNFQRVCGVPYTALPLATIISIKHNIPMLIRRKEVKDYGTKNLIEGHFQAGEHCLVVEDIVTSGTSILETVEALKGVGMNVTDAVVLLDREQGGLQRLEKAGIKLHSVCTISKVLNILLAAEKLNVAKVNQVQEFISTHKFLPHAKLGNVMSPEKNSKKTYTFNERAKLCSNAVSRRLFEVMEIKQSNLIFSADVTQTHLLFQVKCFTPTWLNRDLQIKLLVDKIGPYIVGVKTHVDILEDFTSDFCDRLIKLAKQHNFLIFEDRKFAEIGHSVKLQYDGGIYQISDWADIVDAHALPGSGVIQALKQVGQPRGRACLLIAEMSSAGNLMTPEYTKATVQMAEENSEFVIGFICQKKLTSDPKFLHMTPGVHFNDKEDNLGQRYHTPFEVINQNESDIIIVGRGIIKAEDPVSIAKQYQEAAFSAYRQRLS